MVLTADSMPSMRQKAYSRTFAAVLLGLALGAGAAQAQPWQPDPALAGIDRMAPVATDARQQAIAAVKDETTRNALNDFVGILRHMQRAEEVYLVPPGRTEYVESRLAVLDDYPDVKTMLDVYAAGVVGSIEPDGSISVIPPFQLPYLHSFDWTHIWYSGGAQIPAESESGPGVTLQRKNERAEGVVYPSADPGDAAATAMHGKLSVELPKDIATADFSAADVGQTKPVGDYLFKLTSLSGARAEFETWHRDGGVPGFASDGVIVEARDKSGKVLAPHGRLWEVPGQFERGLLKLDEFAAAAQAGTLRVAGTTDLLERAGWREAQSSFQGRFAFRGPVASVRVTMMVREGEHFTPVTREVEPPVLPINRGVTADGMGPLKLAGSVYDHQVAADLRDRPLELERKDVARKVGVDVIERDGYPQIRFAYPDVLSNRFYRTALRLGLDDAESVQVTFYDAAGKVLQAKEGEAWGRLDDSIAYDPASFAAPPVRAVGQISPRRVTELPRRSMTPAKLPPGIAVNRNMVTVDTSIQAYDPAGMVWLARDKSGRYLVLTGRMALNDPDSGKTSIVHYFQGDVATVETIVHGDEERVPVPFDVKLPHA